MDIVCWGKKFKKEGKIKWGKKNTVIYGWINLKKKNVLCKDIEIENYIQGCCRFQNILPVLATFDLYIWCNEKTRSSFFWFSSSECIVCLRKKTFSEFEGQSFYRTEVIDKQKNIMKIRQRKTKRQEYWKKVCIKEFFNAKTV